MLLVHQTFFALAVGIFLIYITNSGTEHLTGRNEPNTSFLLWFVVLIIGGFIVVIVLFKLKQSTIEAEHTEIMKTNDDMSMTSEESETFDLDRKVEMDDLDRKVETADLDAKVDTTDDMSTVDNISMSAINEMVDSLGIEKGEGEGKEETDDDEEYSGPARISGIATAADQYKPHHETSNQLKIFLEIAEIFEMYDIQDAENKVFNQVSEMYKTKPMSAAAVHSAFFALFADHFENFDEISNKINNSQWQDAFALLHQYKTPTELHMFPTKAIKAARALNQWSGVFIPLWYLVLKPFVNANVEQHRSFLLKRGELVNFINKKFSIYVQEMTSFIKNHLNEFSKKVFDKTTLTLQQMFANLLSDAYLHYTHQQNMQDVLDAMWVHYNKTKSPGLRFSNLIISTGAFDNFYKQNLLAILKNKILS